LDYYNNAHYTNNVCSIMKYIDLQLNTNCIYIYLCIYLINLFNLYMTYTHQLLYIIQFF